MKKKATNRRKYSGEKALKHIQIVNLKNVLKETGSYKISKIINWLPAQFYKSFYRQINIKDGIFFNK